MRDKKMQREFLRNKLVDSLPPVAQGFFWGKRVYVQLKYNHDKKALLARLGIYIDGKYFGFDREPAKDFPSAKLLGQIMLLVP